MSHEEDGFLQAIGDNPEDNAPRMAYADWLEERDDPRAEYLRMEIQQTEAQKRLAELKPTLDPEWIRQVGRRCRARIAWMDPGRKIMAIKLVRELTGLGLKEAKDLVETDPEHRIIQEDLSLDEALEIVGRFKGVAEIALETVTGKPGWQVPEPYQPVSGPYQVRLVSVSPSQRIEAIKLVRQIRNSGLKEARDLVVISGPDRILRDGLSLNAAESIAQQFHGIGEVIIESSQQ